MKNRDFKMPERIENWIPIGDGKTITKSQLLSIGFEQVAGTEQFQKYLPESGSINVVLECPFGLSVESFWRQVGESIQNIARDYGKL